MFGVTEGEARFLTVMFVLGFLVGLPVIVGAVGYAVYRVAVAAWRGW